MIEQPEHPKHRAVTVQATLQVPLATIQLARFQFEEPVDDVLLNPHSHWLELSLSPRIPNARGRYPDRWRSNRFEEIGDVFMIPAGQAFHARGDSGGHIGLLCLFHTDPTRCWFQESVDLADCHLQETLNIRSSNIRSLLFRLGEEAQYPGFASEVMTGLLAEQIVIELARHYRSLKQEQATGTLAQWRLRLIDERLNDLSQIPTLTELATLCQLSERQLTRAFRASRDCSIGNYIAQHRIERAKRALERGERIKAVSYDMGFSSPAAFSHAFRCATGKTPGEYRRSFNSGR